MLVDDSNSASQDIDVDALLSSIESPSTEIAMGDEASPEAASQAQPEAAKVPEPKVSDFQGFEFDYQGKKVQVGYQDPRTKQWLQQGYDYAQRMSQINQQRSEIEAQQKALSRYAEIDQWVKSDPNGQAWLSHLNDSWEKRQAILTGQKTDDPVMTMVERLVEERLAPIKQDFEQRKAQEVEKTRQEQDQQLSTEIESIRKKYADLDWDSPDSDGRSLEWRVLEHANKNGINSFKAAFLDLKHDELEKRWEARGKEALSKEMKERQQKGLLGTSPTPQKASLSQAESVKGKSWDDLKNEALAELGLS